MSAARLCDCRGRPRRAWLRGFSDGRSLSRSAIERHGGSRAFALPFSLVDHLAQEIELDSHVVRILEEDLEELGVREAAEMHLDLVLLDALAHLDRILREEGNVVHGSGSL